MDGMKERLGYEELIDQVRERMMRIIWRIVRTLKRRRIRCRMF
jgi:hypothetical protein